MLRRPVGHTVAELRRLVPNRAAIRPTTAIGIALGTLDVLTTAEHMLVPPIADGNPLLMAVGQVSPVAAYGAFLAWFLAVAAVALVRDDALGYSADAYLLVAFSLTGTMNAAYVLFGTTLFKEFVGQYTAFTHLYIVVLAPIGSLVVGSFWARRFRAD